MIIRRWRPEDAAALARAINDEAVQANLRDGLPFPYTVSDAEAFIGAALSDGSMYSFAVTENDVCIGCISVTRGENIHRLTGELGYYIARERWGRGYATGAVREISAISLKIRTCSASSPSRLPTTPHPAACSKRPASH